MALNESVVERLGVYVADPANRARTQALVRDEEKYKEFLEQFPVASLKNLTLEQYCLGDPQTPRSFSWWLERGLEKALGRYSPGSSKGHLIYRKPDGSYYYHRWLRDLSPSDAMSYVAKIIFTIASVRTLNEARRFDNARALFEAAGVEERVPGGDARRLRLHIAYHPDAFIPINSKAHLDHFLRLFGVDDSSIPAGAAAKMGMLWDIFEAVRSRYNQQLTPNGFASSLYQPELGMQPPARASRGDVEDEDTIDTEDVATHALNRILYGPPGTGKTYRAIGIAVDIIDSAEQKGPYRDRVAVRARFDELCRTGRIGVVTFHQSFSYEDFVEGIRAVVDDKQQLRYEVDDGLFKRMCVDAAPGDQGGNVGIVDVSGRGLWKMSLGTAGSEEDIYDECLEQGYVLLGWGSDVDVTGCRDKQQLRAKLAKGGESSDSFAAEALHRFMHGMKEHDLVVVSEGNHRYRAIGELLGPYKYIEPQDGRRGYRQSRAVRWLRVFDPPRTSDTIMERAFSQQTIYRLKLDATELQRLAALLAPGGGSTARPYVLIIDEINRGDIARIFGELITLLEPDKRWTAAEQLAVRLPYSKKLFSVPANLYLVGTMNTADRSLASLDHALRRRFEFFEVAPNASLLDGIRVEGIDVKSMLEAMNERIELLFDKDHTIGHAYFFPLKSDASLEALARIFDNQVLPLLEEYFFEDIDRVRRVLADEAKSPDNQFYLPRFPDSAVGRPASVGSDGAPIRRSFVLQRSALRSIEAYLGIYRTSTV